MNNTLKIRLLFIAIFCAGLGAILFIRPNTNTNPTSLQETEKNLNEHMVENCVPPEDGYSEVILTDNLPVSLDLGNEYFGETRPIYCIFSPFEEKEHGFISIPTNTNQSIFLYDNDSVEPGRGGEPSLGVVGSFIFTQNDVDLYSYVTFKSDVGDVTLDMATVILRGVKRLPNNIFANYELEISSVSTDEIQTLIQPYVVTKQNPQTGIEAKIVDLNQEKQNTINSNLSELILKKYTTQDNLVGSDFEQLIDTLSIIN